MITPSEEIAGNGTLRPDLASTLGELTALRTSMAAAPATAQACLDRIHPTYLDSARNLLHYLALRRNDLRSLQTRLAVMGLSSLGRAESHPLATVDAVLTALRQLAGAPATAEAPARMTAGVNFAGGQMLLARHSEALLGPASSGRSVRIMVTMPGEAAEEYELVYDLLRCGMDCMRINCAHDDAAAWLRMIEHLRRAEKALGRTCRVVMDLAGPKLRTGPLEPGPEVIRIRPHRDAYGRVVTPARVWLTSADQPHPAPSFADAVLPVPAAWLARLRTRERIRFKDMRRAERDLTIVSISEQGCWAIAAKTAYVASGMTLYHTTRRGGAKTHKGAVGTLPARESVIDLVPGSMLVITRNNVPGRPAVPDRDGVESQPAVIGCTIPEAFDNVQAGEQIWFDDGRIGGVIEKVESTQVLIRITQTRSGGAKLRGDRGINLPDSDLQLPALTAKDIEDLPFVVRHADVVELSFANSARDVELLQEQIASLGERRPGVVLKIETRRAFENLPAMLLAAMRMPTCGVMIARGDLAVECGFERLAEVQEEILWISEAAHVPVIWATQVLENLAKEGMPSRAEITDAAMGHRAECVTLNKGPHAADAVRLLDDILHRMESHQAKKSSMLRELRLASALNLGELCR
ncbi:MAG: pyruvate kinase [Bacteroidetes bacterium]|nr:pyruvate kinase [Bacteroidota bacterium]